VRFVVLGAGAIGGSVGSLLSRAGHDVLLVARGQHAAAIEAHGLQCETPDGVFVAAAPLAREVQWRHGDVALLAVKTQDAEGVLRNVPADVPVVCLTNGIAAERIAAAFVRTVLGAYVFVPASHLVPGVVQLWASPVAGVIDIGLYPTGSAAIAAPIAEALRSAGFKSEARDDVMRFKRGKLLMNLGNIVEALCGPCPYELDLLERARAEAVACFDAGRLDYVIDPSRFIEVKQIAGRAHPGGSTWQSLTRGKSLEVDYLNGEIVALGRAYGVATPTNAGLQRVAHEGLERGVAPGGMSFEELEAAVTSR
jgi:2-dehydropantoate 2-reductase